MKIKALLQRYPVSTYFILVFLIAYGSFLIVAGPALLRGQTEPPTALYILFPIRVLSVCLPALAFIGILDGREGLRKMFASQGRFRVNVLWYVVVLLFPPALMLVILMVFRTVVSPVFTPKFLAIGFLFGVPAILEEMGWMGYAFPKMQEKQSPLAASILLGVLWGLWYAPVVDDLGVAAPHGAYWLAFFLAYIVIVAALRVLMAWVYVNTKSLLLVWLMHFSLTAALVTFDPAQVSPGQETLWYFVFGIALCVIVLIVAVVYGKNLVRQPMQAQKATQVQAIKTAIE